MKFLSEQEKKMRKTLSNESGRSMIEMLGVLAIIGVLSVGGIAGYSMAMSKFKTTKTIDQIQQITTNMRSLLESQRRWPQINSAATFYSLGILNEETYDGSSKGINPFGGEISLDTGTTSARAFTISYKSLPKDVCIKLGTTDWGGDAGSGLFSIQINGKTTHTWSAGTLPIDIASALSDCDEANENTISWVYK